MTLSYRTNNSKENMEYKETLTRKEQHETTYREWKYTEIYTYFNKTIKQRKIS